MTYQGPEWAKDLWKVDSLYCLKTTGGGYALVDMDLQVTVFSGTLLRCYDWCLSYTTPKDRSNIFGLDVVDLAGTTGELTEMDLDFLAVNP